MRARHAHTFGRFDQAGGKGRGHLLVVAATGTMRWRRSSAMSSTKRTGSLTCRTCERSIATGSSSNTHGMTVALVDLSGQGLEIGGLQHHGDQGQRSAPRLEYVGGDLARNDAHAAGHPKARGSIDAGRGAGACALW